MATKTYEGRILHKHDTEANWLKAVNFVPKLSELIVYDADDKCGFPRMKVGDGVTKVSDLPFMWEPLTKNDIDTICNATIVAASEVTF